MDDNLDVHNLGGALSVQCLPVMSIRGIVFGVQYCRGCQS